MPFFLKEQTWNLMGAIIDKKMEILFVQSIQAYD